jgi:hypothetical protein
MKRSFRIGIVPLSLLALAVALFLVLSPLAPIGPLASDEPSHEVWMLDQSGFPPSAVPSTDIGDIGGTLYIFNGNKLAGKAVSNADPEVIDLAGELAE